MVHHLNRSLFSSGLIYYYFIYLFIFDVIDKAQAPLFFFAIVHAKNFREMVESPVLEILKVL